MQKWLNQKIFWDTKKIMDELSQHDKLKIVISSSDRKYSLPKYQYEKFLSPHKGEAYFFMFYEKGVSDHRVDLQQVKISSGQLLFVLPNQIHSSPQMKRGIKFFTLSFAQNCLSLLPQQYPFLIDPFHISRITFGKSSKRRVIAIFGILNELLHSEDNHNTTDIMIAYLNSLLAEFNNAYFRNTKANKSDLSEMTNFIQFKLKVEMLFRKQPSIHSIAAELSMSENKLYKIVKNYSGLSPKEYLIQRLILEAQRILFYNKSSAKELAYELGFSDPDYFTRLFKKQTGKNISQFLAHLEDLSRKNKN
jgi:AraC family transcriptional activator of pobA